MSVHAAARETHVYPPLRPGISASLSTPESSRYLPSCRGCKPTSPARASRRHRGRAEPRRAPRMVVVSKPLLLAQSCGGVERKKTYEEEGSMHDRMLRGVVAVSVAAIHLV